MVEYQHLFAFETGLSNHMVGNIGGIKIWQIGLPIAKVLLSKILH